MRSRRATVVRWAALAAVGVLLVLPIAARSHLYYKGLHNFRSLASALPSFCESSSAADAIATSVRGWFATEVAGNHSWTDVISQAPELEDLIAEFNAGSWAYSSDWPPGTYRSGTMNYALDMTVECVDPHARHQLPVTAHTVPARVRLELSWDFRGLFPREGGVLRIIVITSDDDWSASLASNIVEELRAALGLAQPNVPVVMASGA